MTMAKNLMVLGAGIYQIPAIIAAKEMGCRVIALDGNAGAPGLKMADVLEVVDLRDVAGCIEIASKYPLDGVVSICTEVAVRTTAAVAEAKGLPGISRVAAIAATDKVVMRNKLVAAGIPCPGFKAVANLDDAQRAAREMGFPLIIKPVDNAGSRGVIRVENVDGLDWALANALAFSRTKKAIIEEFMVGVESTVEALSWDGECEILAMSDKRHVSFPNCVAVSLDYPPEFPADIQDEIKTVVLGAVRALGIDCGPTHTEVMVTDEGVKIVEVAARGGGFRVFSDMIPLVSGVDAVGETIKMALGEVPDIKAKKQQGAVLRFFNPNQTGKLQRVTGVETARSLPGVIDVQIDVKPGDEIGPVTSDGDRPGYLIATGRDRNEVMKRACLAEKTVFFEVS